MNKAFHIVVGFFLIWLMSSCTNANEKNNTNKELVANKLVIEKQDDKIIIPLKRIALKLKETGREDESKILLEALKGESICIIKNEYSAKVQFDKPINVLPVSGKIENCFVVMSAFNQNDSVFVKMAKPYFFSDGIVKGGIGWSISISESEIKVTSLEF